MADAGVSELFMLLRACDDRRVLEEIYNRGGGEGWDRELCAGWMTDAPLSEWEGVTADADGNVTALELNHKKITDAGAAALAEVLPGSLITAAAGGTSLDLVNNQITSPLPPPPPKKTAVGRLGGW
jgi:hypothetical protein